MHFTKVNQLIVPKKMIVIINFTLFSSRLNIFDEGYIVITTKNGGIAYERQWIFR
ncbi:hypothetical protein NCCP2222_22360 [Sporosarcina sp. NCCP-2222]|nr:hypothetical protein NCCP2222_22360 [Sporosarcina sp. NCCP-2222]